MKKLFFAAGVAIAMHAAAQSAFCDSVALSYLRQDLLVAQVLLKTLPDDHQEMLGRYYREALAAHPGQSVSWLQVNGEQVRLVEMIGQFPEIFGRFWERNETGCPSFTFPIAAGNFVRLRNKSQ